MNEQRNLHDLIQELPQELIDLISNYTFTANPAIQHIDNTYKPPTLLQVSRATRGWFATSYYIDSIFEFNVRPWNNYQIWLSALPPKHLRLVRSIRVRTDPPATDNPNEPVGVTYQRSFLRTSDTMGDWQDWQEQSGISVEHITLRVNVQCYVYDSLGKMCLLEREVWVCEDELDRRFNDLMEGD